MRETMHHAPNREKGQDAPQEQSSFWGRALGEKHSRRLDVDGPSAYAPKPGVKYSDITNEENLSYIEKAQDIAKKLIK